MFKLNFLYVLILLFSSSAFAAMETRVLSLDGAGVAKIRRAKGTEIIAARGDLLGDGDTLITSATVAADLQLVDGSIVRVGVDTEYQVKGIQEEKKGIFSWVFSLAKGSIRAAVMHSPENGFVKFKVDTPSGTMGVRGTELVLRHDPVTKQTSLFTMHGAILFAARGENFNRSKAVRTVNGGFMSTITEGEKIPTPPKHFSTEEFLGENKPKPVSGVGVSAALGLAAADGKKGKKGAAAKGDVEGKEYIISRTKLSLMEKTEKALREKELKDLSKKAKTLIKISEKHVREQQIAQEHRNKSGQANAGASASKGDDWLNDKPVLSAGRAAPTTLVAQKKEGSYRISGTSPLKAMAEGAPPTNVRSGLCEKTITDANGQSATITTACDSALDRGVKTVSDSRTGGVQVASTSDQVSVAGGISRVPVTQEQQPGAVDPAQAATAVAQAAATQTTDTSARVDPAPAATPGGVPAGPSAEVQQFVDRNAGAISQAGGMVVQRVDRYERGTYSTSVCDEPFVMLDQAPNDGGRGTYERSDIR